MFPGFVIRAFTLALGYMYPGYKCFKTLQKRRPDVKDLTFWCRYWTLIAVGATLEFVADPFLSWIPMYPEAKLAGVVFLWHPNTLGADYVYERFLTPLLVRHEPLIDEHLKEVQQQVQQMATHLWLQGCTFAQVRFMELLSFLYALSTEAARQANSQRSPLPQQRQVQELQVEQDDEDEEEYTFVDRPSPRAPGVVLREIERLEEEVEEHSENIPLSTLVPQDSTSLPLMSAISSTSSAWTPRGSRRRAAALPGAEGGLPPEVIKAEPDVGLVRGRTRRRAAGTGRK